MTDKYIRIWNKADSVSRISLEKLGYSTKRNDPTTIGQFGSGIKFAPIAAIRNGMKWFFSGSDNNGDYILEYVVETEDGIDCIAYKYGDYIKSSSFTLDAGCLSWSDYFQIYREPVANAMDSSNGDKQSWGIEIVDEQDIKTYPGEFCVFITATPELMKVHNNFDKYFLVNRKLVCNNTGNSVEMYEKIDDSFRVYSHGVLVHENSDIKSLYDYNIDAIQLNEERNIKSLWDLEYTMTTAIAGMKSSSIIKDLISAGMSPDASAYFEFSKLNSSTLSYSVNSDAWRSAFTGMFTDNAVIYDSNGLNANVDTHIRLIGHSPVYVGNDIMYSIFKNSGIKDYTSTLSERVNYDIDFDIKKYPKLTQAIDIASQFEDGIKTVYSRIGVWQSDDITVYGKTINMEKSVDERIIIINKDHVDSSNLADLVATVIHEYDHLSTGIRDGNSDGRLFRDLADRRIGRMMVKFSTDNFYDVVDGVLLFPWNKMNLLNGNMTWDMTPIDATNKVAIRVGGRILMVTGAIDCNVHYGPNYSGKLSMNSDSDALFIDGLINVKDVRVIE